MPPPQPYRIAYRTFDRVSYDPRKSDEVLADRGFDLGYVSRMFPGYVLEREDTRPYAETRYQAIGEVLGDLYAVVYTRSGGTCRLITAWGPNNMKEKSGTPPCDEGLVWADLSDPNRGRIDPSRMGKHHPRDPAEFGSPVTEADVAATLALFEKQKRRRVRKTG